MRIVNVAAAQLGPIQKADSREAVVKRMIALMDEAKAKGADLIVYPELALTTFFPRWYMEDQAEVDAWFEREMPNAATQAAVRARGAAPDRHELRLCRADAGRAPFQHLHPDRQVRQDRRQVPQGSSAGSFGIRYRTRLPASGEALLRAGDLGFNVWRALGGIVGMAICNDRRWPETYRVMGLQGVEMVLIGYNTPSVNSQKSEEGPEKRHVPQPAVRCRPAPTRIRPGSSAVAKAGVEDGHPLFGGSLIVNPDGEIVVEAKTEEDELLVHPCDLDATGSARRRSSISPSIAASSIMA